MPDWSRDGHDRSRNDSSYDGVPVVLLDQWINAKTKLGMMPTTVAAEIVERIAAEASERTSRKLIRSLQATVPGLLKAAGARNLWDEICVQIRTESDLTDMYVLEMEKHLRPILTSLPEIDRVAIWLCAGENYRFEDYDETGDFDAASAAITEHTLVGHILSAHVMGEAWNYENAAIRRMTDY
jgi:hypothetical protein